MLCGILCNLSDQSGSVLAAYEVSFWHLLIKHWGQIHYPGAPLAANWSNLLCRAVQGEGTGAEDETDWLYQGSLPVALGHLVWSRYIWKWLFENLGRYHYSNGTWFLFTHGCCHPVSSETWSDILVLIPLLYSKTYLGKFDWLTKNLPAVT